MLISVVWMITGCDTVSETTSGPQGDWQLVWEDEFDGDANTPPNPEVWKHDVGGNGWGNNQLEYNTDRTDNVRLTGEGQLEIVAQREEYEGNAYTSGRILTEGLWEGGYGRYEARIQVPQGQGVWPAFWMLGAEFETVGWPTCGEIDILEMRGDDPFMVHGTVHGPGYSGGEGVGGSYESGVSFAEEFHIFRVDIDPDHISWYLDDEEFFTLRSGEVPEGAPWAFDGEYFLLLNVAVGGQFLDDPTEDTEFPVSMLVDYVRYYERIE